MRKILILLVLVLLPVKAIADDVVTSSGDKFNSSFVPKPIYDTVQTQTPATKYTPQVLYVNGMHYKDKQADNGRNFNSVDSTINNALTKEISTKTLINAHNNLAKQNKALKQKVEELDRKVKELDYRIYNLEKEKEKAND